MAGKAAAGAGTLSGGIVAWVRDELFRGRLTPGAPLGSAADLAARFGVSRTAVRDALSVLLAQGIVEIRRGAGGGIRVRRGDADALAETLAVQLKLVGVTVAEVVDAHRAAEVGAVTLAAMRADAEDVLRLRQALAAAAKLAEDAAAFNEAIMAFHVLLAEIGRNRVLRLLLRAFVPVLLLTYGANTTPQRARSVVRAYSGVVRAIAAGDAAGAAAASARHLDKVRRVVARRGLLHGTPPTPPARRRR
jgi:GntR family transcriptional repressor for pyruvate dehydrogenase complex